MDGDTPNGRDSLRYVRMADPIGVVVHVTDVIDRSRISRFQIVVFGICALCLVMDGFDVQALGYVLPAVSQELGAFGIAWGIGRRGFVPVLAASFALASLSIASIGQVIGGGLAPGLLAALVFVAGWCVLGGQPGLNALAATYYPTRVRSTGIGWTLGVGRIGGILGPVLGGILLERQWTTPALFMVAAAPALVSAVAMLTLRPVIAPPTTHAAAQV